MVYISVKMSTKDSVIVQIYLETSNSEIKLEFTQFNIKQHAEK